MNSRKYEKYNLTTRTYLVAFILFLFLVYLFLLIKSYQKFQQIESRTKKLVEKFDESQGNMVHLFEGFSKARQSFVLFSRNQNKSDLNQYLYAINTLKQLVDSIANSRERSLKADLTNYLTLEQHKKVQTSLLNVTKTIYQSIEVSNRIDSCLNIGDKPIKIKQLIGENFITIYAIDESILSLNRMRLLVKKEIVTADKEDIINESRKIRIEAILSLLFMLLLISVIIYYYYYTSIYIQRINSEKRYADRLAEKTTQIFTDITHEIRTPINALIGVIDILRKKGNYLDENDQILIQTVYTNISNTSKVINDILSLKTKNPFEDNFGSFDVKRTIDDIINLYQSQAKIKKLSLIYKFPKIKNITIYSDEFKIRQIIGNLLSNAIKYSDKGNIECNVNILNSSLLQIKVIDEGIGIALKNRHNLFKKYFTAESDNKYSNGLGIGLYITKKLVKFLKGKITVVSTVHEGSTFVVEIPIKVVNNKTQNSHNYKNLDDLPITTSWLIVDDNALNLFYMSQFFKRFPNTKTAVNGKEALALLNEETFDLVITDINMPMMTGDELLIEIKKRSDLEKIKVIATSSNYEQIKKIEEKNNCYFDGILIKPFNERDLTTVILNTIQA